ncbi:hypothetical protein DB88DRAFT_478695 [Papiliotrema laurentii]|uniref:Uncharacterized protein n=1 Tax=Papiliotrema laurentii TaxID=5418 RepID=A0AAD9L925_PAPLA|nr:hypothetical protein DB88DRAFT_478695 [Papiliotrema laurentii]
MSEQTPLLGQHDRHHHVNAPSPVHRLSSPRISFPKSTSSSEAPIPPPSTRGKSRQQQQPPPHRQSSFPFYATPSPIDTPDQAEPSDLTPHGDYKTRTRQTRFTSQHALSPSEFSSSGLSSMSDDSAMTLDEEGQTHSDLHKDHQEHHHHHHHHHHRRHHQHSDVYDDDEQSRHHRRHAIQTGERAEPYHFGLRKDGLPKFSRQCLWSEIKCYGSYILPPLFIFGVLAIGSGLIFVAIKRKWI